ncbi:OPT oligopeptide transporter protein-domain-containing protein [Syncephalis fuscata]|nr:OPT oligopeptide transporter protein-domain-containing protein [Syncephalis fuscata]
MGILMAMSLPRRQFNVLGWSFSFNPGPFNMKEHMLIGVSANTGGTAAYAIDIIAVQRLFYGRHVGPLEAILLLLTTQCIGYGMAGMLRRFLVTPASMIWPSNLVQVALYNTLHGTEPANQGMKRQTFFMIVACATFVYQLLPFYIAPILSSMAILCWIAPKNGVAQLFGSGYQGLGMLNFSFDWSAVGSFGPLYTPWWAQLNFFFGTIVTLWIVAPIMYFNNVWEAKRFDLVTPEQFDEDGGEFDIMRVLTSDLELDEPRLAAYSNLRMSPVFALTYGTAFMIITATLTHVFLYYRHSIYRQFKASRTEKEDIHTRLMRAYPDVPISWYAGIFVIMLVAAIIVCEVYPIKLPCNLGILVLPIGIIQAVSNNRVGLNVITELICGYMLPGRPIANVAFKVYGYMTMFQCLLLVEDMKLGHYMKILHAKFNYGVLEWLVTSKFDILSGKTPDPSGQWEARNTKIFFSASIIWGVMGPARVFGQGSPYEKYPNGKWHLINIPIMGIGTFAVPQSPANFIFSGFIVAFVFQYYLYRRHHGWWKRYNYVLSAALDAGTQICIMFVVVALSDTPFPVWIGNSRPSVEICDLSLLEREMPAQVDFST